MHASKLGDFCARHEFDKGIQPRRPAAHLPIPAIQQHINQLLLTQAEQGKAAQPE
jgi:hypothetical protein